MLCSWPLAQVLMQQNVMIAGDLMGFEEHGI
jgi:hypothetical protein